MDLKTKFAFSLVAASLLSMAALGYFTHLWAEDLFLEDSQRQLDAVSEEKKNDISAVFDSWEEDVRALVGRVQSSEPSPLEGITSVLRDAGAPADGLRQLTLLDAEGKPLAGTDDAELVAVAALPDDDVAFSGIRVEPDESIGIVFHAWLALDGQRVGVVEAVFDGRALDRFVGRTPGIGKTGETSLIARTVTDANRPGSGEDAYLFVGSSTPGEEADRSRLPLSEMPEAAVAALRGLEQVFVGVKDRRGQPVIAVTRFLPDPDWGLVVKVGSAEARQRADRLLANMRDLGVSLAAFAILGGTLFGLHLGRPIQRLVREVDRIRHGEIDLRLEVRGEDEVAFLAESLNEFMNQLDRSSDLFRLGELRVLVIDPDARNRYILAELLQSWNMRPTVVEGLAGASSVFEQARHAGRPTQLILLDESIVETDAARWAEQLRWTTSDSLPMILLSSKADSLDADRLKEAGISRIVSKPVIASHLMEAILDEMGVSAEGLASVGDVYFRKMAPRKILLVEDNQLMQQVTMGFLEASGHEVTLAENGRVATEATRREGFDLILMDVEMPELNGLDATAAIRAQERNDTERTPIVALTAEAGTEDRERCIAAGMDGHLAKPVDPKALYALVARYPARILAPRLSDEPVPAADDGPLDWEVARTNTGGDEGLLDELIEIFPTESARQLAAMHSAIENGDAERLTRSAHTLKSAALVFGASCLAGAALSMETLGRREDLDAVGPLLETLEVETRRLNAALGSRRGRDITRG